MSFVDGERSGVLLLGGDLSARYSAGAVFEPPIGIGDFYVVDELAQVFAPRPRNDIQETGIRPYFPLSARRRPATDRRGDRQGVAARRPGGSVRVRLSVDR